MKCFYVIGIAFDPTDIPYLEVRSLNEYDMTIEFAESPLILVWMSIAEITGMFEYSDTEHPFGCVIMRFA